MNVIEYVLDMYERCVEWYYVYVVWKAMIIRYVMCMHDMLYWCKGYAWICEKGMYENIMENMHELVGLAIEVYYIFTTIMFEVYGNGTWMNEG